MCKRAVDKFSVYGITEIHIVTINCRAVYFYRRINARHFFTDHIITRNKKTPPDQLSHFSKKYNKL